MPQVHSKTFLEKTPTKMSKAKPGKVTFDVLASRVKESCDDAITKTHADFVIRTAFDEIKKALLAGDVISLTHFGVIEAKVYPARKMANANIGNELIDLPERRVPKFKPSTGFRDAFNPGPPVDEEDMV